MKTNLWIVIVVVSGMVGFLMGYSISSFTGVRHLQSAQAKEDARQEKPGGAAPASPAPAAAAYGAQKPVSPPAEAGGYGMKPASVKTEAGGYGAQKPAGPKAEAGGYGAQK
jgi:hypothetical protein